MLSEIMKTKLSEVEALKNRMNRNVFKEMIAKPGLSIIAEFKRQSPSKGVFSTIKRPEDIVNSGADAVSVLTDEQYFNGSLNDLVGIQKPLLRKDFIIDRSQIIQSLMHGVDAVLLIVSVLQRRTAELIQASRELGLVPVVEIYSHAELDIALDAGADLILVNNRNLKTFEVDVNHCLEMKKNIPDLVLTVAASGVASLDDVKKIKDVGYDAVLIGEMMMRSDDPKQLIQQMRAIQ